jgi:hypothetical protein
MGRPVSGSLSATAVPGDSSCVLPSTLKPVTLAWVPAGRLALLSTLPLRVWPMGVAGVSGASENTALGGVPAGSTLTLTAPGLVWPSLHATV